MSKPKAKTVASCSTPPIASAPLLPATTSAVVFNQTSLATCTSSSSSVSLSRMPSGNVAAEESCGGVQQIQSHALFEKFLDFLSSRDPVVTSQSVPALVQGASVLDQAPAVLPMYANPPKAAPGIALQGGSILAQDSRPFRPQMANNPAPALRCAGVQARGVCEDRSVPPSRSAFGGRGMMAPSSESLFRSGFRNPILDPSHFGRSPFPAQPPTRSYGFDFSDPNFSERDSEFSFPDFSNQSSDDNESVFTAVRIATEARNLLLKYQGDLYHLSLIHI